MSMDLTGIRNQNEYYTNHYFSSVFEQNAMDTIRQWREEAAASEDRAPFDKLKTVAGRYFTLLDQASRLPRKNDVRVGVQITQLAGLVLGALGYDFAPDRVRQYTTEDGLELPIAMEVTKPNGAPLLWAFLSDDSIDGEERDIMASTRLWPMHEGDEDGRRDEALTNEELLSKVLFGLDEPPRWVLFIGLRQIALIDRNKWNDKRFLVFQLDDIFARREDTTLQAMAVLLHKDSIAKGLLDVLDDNSHKHASEVSKDLKYALRECIELLGNEVVRDMRERQHVGVYGKELADELTIQCLRYMYRIMFLLFIEARPELGYAPMKAEVYALGYSFESLREIADRTRADTDIERDGHYLKQSLDLLFKLIYEGYPSEEMLHTGHSASVQGVFRIEPLKAHIFDPERTPLIEKAQIANGVLLDIIDRMSVTRGGKGKRRGRISYSNLGINQLGSVYEALLSYRGFFAEEDLYEVKKKGDKVDDLDVGYFVTEAELDQYDEDERVRVDENNPVSDLRVHLKGEFIYRLAGREREKSASYYTPEVLTHCLVKYALKELLEGKTADEILRLTICEPAMGSAAFLNEAVSQLAEAYLTRKEQETGESVPHDKRVQELQRIKMFIADRNVYGIDLNPIAVELAEVSLWLNSIFEGGYVPWFRTQIVNGNSLIGARRQCYTLNQARAQAGPAVWYNNAPERIEPGQQRKFSRQIYHFLLGDPGMCAYTDKVIKSLEPEKIDHIKKWNKAFTKPLTEDECDRVLELSSAVDRLWDEHVRIRGEISRKTTDPLSVWGQPEDTQHHPLTIREKDRIYDSLYLTEHQQNAGPYARLKAAMDYWCALWFWPIDRAEELPTRQEFLFDMYALLGVDIVNASAKKKQSIGQIGMFDDEFYDNMYSLFDTLGEVNLDQLRSLFPRMRIADEVAKQQHFFHWELEFADVFAERGGFDLVIGNPPWIKVTWEEKDILSEAQPIFAVRKTTASQLLSLRGNVISHREYRIDYINEYCSTSGQQNYINAIQNYPDLRGLQGNVYECFIPQSWTFANTKGVFALIHPESVFNEQGGYILRQSLNAMLRKHFRFSNALKLFPDVHTSREFGLNVYCNYPRYSFDQIVNLYTPTTIDECYENDDHAPVYIRNEDGTRNIKGSRERITVIGKRELMLFADLLDASMEWRQARLMAVHTKSNMEVLELFSRIKTRITTRQERLSVSMLWDETNAQKDKTIVRNVHFGTPEDTILSGAHIGLANPLFNCSNAGCKNNNDNTSVDLTAIPKNYIQRCNYSLVDRKVYVSRIPNTPWGKLNTDCYRIGARKMVDIEGERTVVAALLPPEFAHTNGIINFAFDDIKETVTMLGGFCSLPFDFFIKSCGKGNLQMNTAGMLPILEGDDFLIQGLRCRIMLLNCLTEYYGSAWEEVFNSNFVYQHWSKDDKRLQETVFAEATEKWNPLLPIRNDYARRQALVEIDVIVAKIIGLSLEQLLSVYRVQFPILQQHEKNTYYDAKGRIVYAKNNALTGVGVSRKAFENPGAWQSEGITLSVDAELDDASAALDFVRHPAACAMKDAPAGCVFSRTINDDTQPGGPIQRTIEYHAPFDRCDREQDYETAWVFFTEHR